MRAAVLLIAVALAGCGNRSPSVSAVRVPGEADATGFAAGDGRVLTVAHVLRPGRPVLVAGHRAHVVHVDRRLDVALLAVAGVRGEARRGAPHTGQRASVRVLRAGAPRSLPVTVRRLITARIGGHVRPALELAGAVRPGDSGAPVLDGDGRLLGVVFAQASGPEALAYALDARAL